MDVRLKQRSAGAKLPHLGGLRLWAVELEDAVRHGDWLKNPEDATFQCFYPSVMCEYTKDSDWILLVTVFDRSKPRTQDRGSLVFLSADDMLLSAGLALQLK